MDFLVNKGTFFSRSTALALFTRASNQKDSLGKMEENDAQGGREDFLEAGASFFFPLLEFLGGMRGTVGVGGREKMMGHDVQITRAPAKLNGDKTQTNKTRTNIQITPLGPHAICLQ